ncbi:MAG: SUMF1/EgtB/PvdO family nonheme iron enzyme, partial [Planctomycetes bacterium]|nr:SUMF1/EgtB/PvdO family nonheme iron enzyme [Planctomycetota bacterium]
SLEPDTATVPNTPSPSSSGDALPFNRLGHYEIVGRIGHGGMGDVYKGYEKDLDRTVAIKELPADFARQDEFVKRFYAEATAAAKLSHPNVIEIYYIGNDQGHHFFAMQYVEGESLSDVLRRRKRLDVEETLTVIGQALSGLNAAHKAGLVHRDIKPGNLLIDRKNNRVLLADFGLVKSLQAISHMTATGVIMGTVDYISPEQGRGLDVDTRSDLYSIGVLMYQMLSGRMPFEADSPTAMIFQHVYETAEPLNRITDNVPMPLVAIVEKLMAKSPDNRYQKAEEVLDDLRAFKSDEPLPSGADVFVLEDDEAVDVSLEESSAGLADDSNRETQQTAIITVPHFASDPLLPSNLNEAAPTGWWERLKNKSLDFFEEKAPEFINNLQNTQQQVDGAVREYERRRISLSQLIDEAEHVLDELLQQEQNWFDAAKQSQSDADAQSDTLKKQQALEHTAQCEQKARELNQQNQEQQEQLDTMRLRMAKVTATLERLRSQKDVLNARLKMAQVQLKMSSGVSDVLFWKRFLKRHFRPIAGVTFVLLLSSTAILLFYWNYSGTIPSSKISDSSNLETTLEHDIAGRLVLIPEGEFLMGSTEDELESRASERPQHKVVIDKPFYMGAYEVTYDQFRRFVSATGYKTDAGKFRRGGSGYDSNRQDIVSRTFFSWKNTGFKQSDSHPVVNVSWNDAVAFCRWLTAIDGKHTYRLPTEAEREYAGRAGTATEYGWGKTARSMISRENVADSSLSQILSEKSVKKKLCESWSDRFSFAAPVGSFTSNKWGLYDTHGNVCEWCQDNWDENRYLKPNNFKPPSGGRRVSRGGSFLYRPEACRVARRFAPRPPNDIRCDLGFRIVRDCVIAKKLDM